MLLDPGHRVRVLDRLFFGRDLIAPLEKRDGLTIVKDDIRYASRVGLRGRRRRDGSRGDLERSRRPIWRRAITEEINLDGAVRMAQLAKEAGVSRYIYSSSCSIYGHGERQRRSARRVARRRLRCRCTRDEDRRRRGAREAERRRLHGDVPAQRHRLRPVVPHAVRPRHQHHDALRLQEPAAVRDGRRPAVAAARPRPRRRPRLHAGDGRAAREGRAARRSTSARTTRTTRSTGSPRWCATSCRTRSWKSCPDDPDKRSYNVSFDKIERVLGFKAEKTPYEGIVEVKQALEQGRVDDYDPHQDGALLPVPPRRANGCCRKSRYNGREVF